MSNVSENVVSNPELDAQFAEIVEAADTANGRLGFAMSIAQGAASRLGGLLRLTGNVEFVIATAQATYDKFAKPLDMPILSDATEELFDNFAKAAIADLLRTAAKQGV